MAGFLEGFSNIAKLAYPIVQRGVRELLSGNAIIGVLRKAGLTFRRQRMLDLVREERSLVRSFDTLKNIRPEFKPQLGSLREAAGRIRRQFAFVVEIQGRDLATDSFTTRHVTISSDSILTRFDLEELALGMMDEDTYTEDFEATGAVLTSGVRAGPSGTL